MREEDHWDISLSAYFELVGRLARDDQFVARYLLRRVITLLCMVVNTGLRKWSGRRDSIKRSHFLHDLFNLILDALDLSIGLVEANIIEVPADVFVDCYEDIYDDPEKESDRYSVRWSCAEFIDGCGSIWRWAPFLPSQRKLGDKEPYYVHLDEIERRENGTIRGLVVPFSAFIEIFRGFQRQLPTAHTSPVYPG